MIDASTFDELIAEITGGEPVRLLLRAKGVSCRQFYGALAADEAKAERYTRAKASAIEALADETIAIADDGENDTYLDEETGERRSIADVVQRSRLRVETRKWLLAKLAPKKYGEKLELDAHVSVGDAIVERLARARSEGSA